MYLLVWLKAMPHHHAEKPVALHSCKALQAWESRLLDPLHLLALLAAVPMLELWMATLRSPIAGARSL